MRFLIRLKDISTIRLYILAILIGVPLFFALNYVMDSFDLRELVILSNMFINVTIMMLFFIIGVIAGFRRTQNGKFKSSAPLFLSIGIMFFIEMFGYYFTTKFDRGSLISNFAMWSVFLQRSVLWPITLQFVWILFSAEENRKMFEE